MGDRATTQDNSPGYFRTQNKGEYNMIPQIDLTAGIDTIEVTSSTFLPFSKRYLSHDISRKVDISEERPQFKYRVNPDNAGINITTNNSTISKGITNYYDYQNTMAFIIEDSQLKNTVKTRIDFRFDNYSIDYQILFKLNKALLLLLAITYKVSQTYQSLDMLNGTAKSAKISNKRLAVEFYNKLDQEPESGIQCRLEFRSLALTESEDEDNKELTEWQKWQNRINKAVNRENLKKLTDTLNRNLIELYRSEQARKLLHKPSQFIIKHSDYFLTGQQLTDFYTLLHTYKDPEATAAGFRRTNPIPLLKYTDIVAYCKRIDQASKQYFITGADQAEQDENTENAIA